MFYKFVICLPHHFYTGFSNNLTILYKHYVERKRDGAIHPRIPKTLSGQADSHVQKVQIRKRCKNRKGIYYEMSAFGRFKMSYRAVYGVCG